MGLRQREWARRRYDELVKLLGSKCAKCGTKHKLEVDVIIPQGDAHHRKMNWSSRVTFYYRQLKKNNVQLLCEPHNQSKGATDDKVYYEKQRQAENEPF